MKSWLAKKTVDFHSILSPTASWSVGLPFLKWVGANGQKPPLYLFYDLTTFGDHHEPCSLFCKEKGRVMLTLFIGLGKLCNPSIRQNDNM